MHANKKILFLIICVAQLACIYVLIQAIAKRTIISNRSLGPMLLTPRSIESVIFPFISDLKYYYEPKPLGRTIYDLSIVGINKKVVQTINADGLNEPYEYTTKKPTGTYRIVTLGDSFTEGTLVETKDNWTEQLEHMLNSSMHCSNISTFEVINLGVAGYDMQYSLERFKRKGLRYTPDLVLFLTGQDDFDFSNEFLRGKIKKFDDMFTLDPARLNALHEEGDMYPSYTLAYQELVKERGSSAAEQSIQQEFGYLNELMNLVSGELIIMPYNPLPDTMRESILIFTAMHTNTTYVPYPGDYERFKDQHPTVVGHSFLATQFFTHMKSYSIPCEQ